MPGSLEQVRATLDAAMTGGRAGSTTADRLCLACVEVLGVDGAAISLVSKGADQGTLGASGDTSRRLHEHQFTFGEGPGLDAVRDGILVSSPDLDSPHERRWPMYAGAVLGEGVRAVFALPVVVASVAVGALDLFRRHPGPLSGTDLEGGGWAAHLAATPLLDVVAQLRAGSDDEPEGEDQLEADHGSGFDRVEVYQATGMLIAQLDVDASEAMVRLRAHAMTTGQTASEVAWAIIQRRLVLARDEHTGDGGSES